MKYIPLAAITLALSILCNDGAAQASVSIPPAEGIGELGLQWETGPFAATEDGGLRPARDPIVRGVVPCSLAHVAGIEPGDQILKVDGRSGRSPGLFPDGTPGTEYLLELSREGARLEIRFKIGPRRPDALPPVETAPIGSLEEWGCTPPVPQ